MRKPSRTPPLSQSGDQVVVRKMRKFVITTITRIGKVLAASLYESQHVIHVMFHRILPFGLVANQVLYGNIVRGSLAVVIDWGGVGFSYQPSQIALPRLAPFFILTREAHRPPDSSLAPSLSLLER